MPDWLASCQCSGTAGALAIGGDLDDQAVKVRGVVVGRDRFLVDVGEDGSIGGRLVSLAGVGCHCTSLKQGEYTQSSLDLYWRCLCAPGALL